MFSLRSKKGEKMTINEKTINRIKPKESPYVIDEELYAKLDFSYHMLLFISSLFFLHALHYLNWWSGIGWFFFSRFVSILLVRWDISRNANLILWYEKKNNISDWLN